MRLSYSVVCALTLGLSLACSESPSGSPATGGAGQAGAGQAGSSDAGSGGAGASAGGESSTSGASSMAGAGSPGMAGSDAGGAGGASGGAGGSGGGVGTGCTGKAICWDFEEGKLPTGFTPYRNEGTGSLLVDDTKAYGGNKYALHAKDLQGAEPKHTATYQLPANWGPVLWGRMRLFTAGTRPESHAGFFAAYYVPVGSNDTTMSKLDWYEVASYTQKYMSIWHPPWPPGFPEHVQVSDTPLTLDKWTCVEWQFDSQNEADPEQAGTPRTWLDGVELEWPMIFAYDNVNMQNPNLPKRIKGQNFTLFETGITMWQSMPTPNNWWIDDLGVGPERIGCD